jgi:hypothetical protein
MFFWVKVLCRLVGRSQHFGEAQCLHLRAEVMSQDQPTKQPKNYGHSQTLVLDIVPC